MAGRAGQGNRGVLLSLEHVTVSRCQAPLLPPPAAAAGADVKSHGEVETIPEKKKLFYFFSGKVRDRDN